MPKSVVGLDVGSSHLRAIEAVVHPNGKRTNLKFASVELPTGTIENGAIKNEAAFLSCVRALWASGKFTSKSINLGLGSSAAAIIRPLVMDWSKDFSRVLPFEVEKDDALGIKRNENYMSYFTLNEWNEDRKRGLSNIVVRRKQILFVAVPSKTVDDYIRVLNGHKFRVKSIDLNPLALMRSNLDNSIVQAPLSDTNMRMHIDIGASGTTLVLSRGGLPLYIRSLDGSGGQAITDYIARNLNLSYDEAERLKISVFDRTAAPVQLTTFSSVFDTEESDESAVVGEEESEEEIAARLMVAEHISSITSTIRESFDDFVVRSNSGSGIDQELYEIILSGGMTNSVKIVNRLKVEVNAEETVMSHPFSNRNIKVPNGIIEHEYATAFGLLTANGGATK